MVLIKKLDICKVFCVALITAITLLFALPVMAASASIQMQSEGTAEYGMPVDVQVQIGADKQIGTYYIELEYDRFAAIETMQQEGYDIHKCVREIDTIISTGLQSVR